MESNDEDSGPPFVGTVKDRSDNPVANAKVTVTLADTSLMDAPSKTIATQVIEGQTAPPFKFALAYDPKAIDPRNTYSVSARIEVDGKLRFITDTHTPVITRGAPTHVEMIARGVPQN